MDTIMPPKEWALGGHCHPPSPAGLQGAHKAKEINSPRYFSSQTKSHRGCTQMAANHCGAQQPLAPTPPQPRVPRPPGVAGRGAPLEHSPLAASSVGLRGQGQRASVAGGGGGRGVSAPEDGESLQGAGGPRWVETRVEGAEDRQSPAPAPVLGPGEGTIRGH